MGALMSHWRTRHRTPTQLRVLGAFCLGLLLGIIIGYLVGSI